MVAALTSDPAISSPFTKQDAHLEVGDEGSPGLPPGDEPLSRDSFLRMGTGAEAEGTLSGAASLISAHIIPHRHPETHALRRLVRLIRRRTRGELGQEAAGGSMTREMR